MQGMKREKPKSKAEMTAREWHATPEGQEELRKQGEAIIEQMNAATEPLRRNMEEAKKTMENIANFAKPKALLDSLKPFAEKQMMYAPPTSKPVYLDEYSISAILKGTRKDEKTIKPFLEYRDENIYTRGRLIDFRNQKDNYFLIVTALLLQSDPSGFLSYDDINIFLERHGKKKIKEAEKIRRRISNALITLQRDRRRQHNQFPLALPDGSPTIRTVPGKGLRITK